MTECTHCNAAHHTLDTACETAEGCCPATVSFLALGNGAPDISASIAAISSGNYELALGALLGGPQFS